MTDPPPAPGPAPARSIIIPACNEAARLPPTLERVLDYSRRRGISFEIIVVDDGSRDDTLERARALAARAPELRILENGVNRGKGFSVRHGMLAARGAVRIFSDADLSTPIEECDALEPWLTRGFGVAIGSRALGRSRVEVHQAWPREHMGKVFNLIVQAVALPGLHDTQCGFKAFTAGAAEEIFRRAEFDGFSFDVELLWLARRLGYRVREVPVRWINSPATKVDALRDSARMFRDVCRLRWGRRARPVRRGVGE